MAKSLDSHRPTTPGFKHYGEKGFKDFYAAILLASQTRIFEAADRSFHLDLLLSFRLGQYSYVVARDASDQKQTEQVQTALLGLNMGWVSSTW